MTPDGRTHGQRHNITRPVLRRAYKNGLGSFKNLIHKNYEARKADFYMKAFWNRTKASWLKSWALEGRMGQMEMKFILYFSMGQGYSGERCGLWASCFIYQAIDVYISYFAVNIIWTLNEWYIGNLVLANQIQAHMHACAGMHFSVYQSIDGDIIYICCEYQLKWSYNEWFIGLSVLANQI
jgi:hypothetical protein